MAIWDNVGVKKDTKSMLDIVLEELRKEKGKCTYDDVVKEAVDALMRQRKMAEDINNLKNIKFR